MQKALRVSAFLLLAGSLVSVAVAAPNFVEFESGPVRPLALSADGTRLYAVNTPDNALEVLRVGAGGIATLGSVPVGLEPVSVAVRNAGEVWVVNHLSDSVSIVDVASTPPRVVRTLLVGDEPRDIVFAGPGGNRAFITTAHRGQHRMDASIAAVPGAGDPQLTTPGVGRADVWVFDATNLGATLGGTPQRIVTLFADTPRALAVSADGNTVYAAAFHSGNQTTTVNEGAVCNGFGAAPCNLDGVVSPGGLAGGQVPGGNPGPSTNFQSVTAPEVGLIVKWNAAASQWQDELGRNWNNGVRFHLPDKDVFAIDATTLDQTSFWTGVGTILFNMVVNPANGKIYVSNTEANNATRFEGPGVFGGSTVQGKLALSRVTVLSGAGVQPRHLNKHIDYDLLPAPAGTRQHSLATPTQMVVNGAGTTLYVAAFGSSKIGVLSTAGLEADTLSPASDSANYISVSGGGPGGLVLDEVRNRLYVLTRFDNAVKVVNLATKAEIQGVALHNPEPTSVVQGRPFLYDAFNTSSNGEASCSSCHIFGDMDNLAWDLGNPDDVVTSNPIPINLGVVAGDQNGGAANDEFHPMKGPMTTQTLRGMSNSGAMHWRGDRADGFFGLDTPYAPTATDRGNEDLSFRNFIVAFPGLVGNDDMIASSDMQKFADFQLQVALPPNPVRNIDNTLKGDVNNANTIDERSGSEFFNGTRCSDGTCLVAGFGFTCEGCHELDASAGFFGTGGLSSFENETQILKIAHLRNLYQKVGMFGMPKVPFFNGTGSGAPTSAHLGDQVRGFGFLHDGSTDTLFRFLHATVFNNNNTLQAGFNGPNGGNNNRQSVELYLLAFDTDIAPIVGQQATLSSTSPAAVSTRVDLIDARAGAAFTSKVLGGAVRENDVVAKGVVGGVEKSWYRSDVSGPDSTGGSYLPDDGGASISLASLKTLATTAGNAVTFTAVTPGAGRRAGVDRDLDGALDAQDNCPALANAGQADLDADTAGDVCDNCVAKANGDQSDLDADGVGDVCDNSCGYGTTTLASLSQGTAGISVTISATGTGFAPGAQVRVGGVASPSVSNVGPGSLAFQVPGGLTVGQSYPVEIVNPEGCRSQEAVNLTIGNPPQACGHTGLEAFALLGLVAGARRLGRRLVG